MHWEYSHFYPAIAMSSHVTNWNKKSSIKFRVDVASIGKLGFDIVLEKLSEEEKEFCKQALLNYKSFRNIIWHGDMYRLQNPYENPIASIQYVDDAKSSSVVFSFLVSDRFQSFYSVEPILLKGLDAKKMYRIEEVNIFPGKIAEIDQETTYSGEYLMKFGFNPLVSDKRKSVVVKIHEIN
jgi:alpha-galactosidase